MFKELSLDIETKLAQLTAANSEVDRLKEVNKDTHQISALKETITKKNEEQELVKQMVVDCDKQIKKMEELHKNELTSLKVDKKTAEDSLNCAIEETTKLREKDNTLMDIFRCMNSSWTHTNALKLLKIVMKL